MPGLDSISNAMCLLEPNPNLILGRLKSTGEGAPRNPGSEIGTSAFRETLAFFPPLMYTVVFPPWRTSVII
jgi:hypothetical protein